MAQKTYGYARYLHELPRREKVCCTESVARLSIFDRIYIEITPMKPTKEKKKEVIIGDMYTNEITKIPLVEFYYKSLPFGWYFIKIICH